MITLIHVGFDLILLLLFSIIIKINMLDIALILSASLIDLDHLFAKPVYDPKRNQFKAHFLHKQWEIVIGLSIIILFIRPVLFLGIGLLSHLLLDYVYVRIKKI